MWHSGGGGVGVVDIRNKRGGEGEGWSIVVTSGQQAFQVQGLGCHYFLGQAVPFGYGPGEE